MHLCAMCSCRVERYMQWVFAASAATLFVPVLFHRSDTEDADIDLAKGASPCYSGQRTTTGH